MTMERKKQKTSKVVTRSFIRYVEEELGELPYLLIYAVLEWTLITILFLDGFLAFAANEFAKFFDLKIPCLLCTRIDHAFVHIESDFYYNDSICEFHKKDVSSMAYCHNHKKLSDIRRMCEGCLLSFATERESDCNTYKSLVGILHKDLECFVGDDREIQLSLTDDGVHTERSNTQKCSCCGEPLKVKSSHSKAKNSGMFSQVLASAPTPSPRAYPYATSKNEELPRVRTAELKSTTSEHDSEIHDDDDISNVNRPDSKLREDAKAASVALLAGDDLNEENKTPYSAKGNRFFGIPFTNFAANTHRWSFKINWRSTLEKTGFTPDSTEGCISNEADDPLLNHLNRQVRFDRKSLMALYMELDEERSASAIAANNAMAMITRLQAEKAAVQMEALQYQRMMEEQAEYDEEVLRTTNEMLLKKEEEVKGLEIALGIYREKYGSLMDDEFKECRHVNHEDYYQEFKSQSDPSHSSSISPPKLSEDEDNKEKCLDDHQAVSSRVDDGEGKFTEPFKDFLGWMMKQGTKTELEENGNRHVDNVVETGKIHDTTESREAQAHCDES